MGKNTPVCVDLLVRKETRVSAIKHRLIVLKVELKYKHKNSGVLQVLFNTIKLG